MAPQSPNSAEHGEAATSIGPEDVRRVAGLARLGLPPEAERPVIEGLLAILGHFQVLQQVDTTGVAPLIQPLDIPGVPAADEVAPFPDPRATLVPLTEHAREGFYVVPRVLDDAEPA